jgi:hypothetical protein
MVGRAGAEAEALVAAARETATAREAALAAELAADGRRLERAVADERRRREAELARDAERQVRLFDELGADRVAALAREVVDRVIGAES